MEVTEIKRIYAYYSRVYDIIFKRWFFPRQRHAIESLHMDPGQHILDVGVGTGFSLPLYPQHTHVVGVDLSSKMLREAQKKVLQKRLTHVALMEMDASQLAFPDSTFDIVIVAFVISVVSDPLRVLAEIKRVSKPGQRIYSGRMDIPSVMGGVGTTIISTSKGLMTDKQARKNKIGGEIVCQIW